MVLQELKQHKFQLATQFPEEAASALFKDTLAPAPILCDQFCKDPYIQNTGLRSV